MIVDQSELLRLGLQKAVETEVDIEVVGSFEPTYAMAAEVARLSPDVALVGMEWSTCNDLSICWEIRNERPSTKVVILSSSESEEKMVSSMIAGASGYISKDATRVELAHAIRAVASSGGAYFNQEATNRMLERLRELMEIGVDRAPPLLTEREKAILAMVAQGSSNDQIGQRLNVATPTVRNNMTAIRSKLGLNSRAKLKDYALRHGLVSEADEETAMPGGSN